MVLRACGGGGTSFKSYIRYCFMRVMCICVCVERYIVLFIFYNYFTVALSVTEAKPVVITAAYAIWYTGMWWCTGVYSTGIHSVITGIRSRRGSNRLKTQARYKKDSSMMYPSKCENARNCKKQYNIYYEQFLFVYFLNTATACGQTEVEEISRRIILLLLLCIHIVSVSHETVVLVLIGHRNEYLWYRQYISSIFI